MMPFHPALPPSMRFSRSPYCAGGNLASMLIAAAPAIVQCSADRRRVLQTTLVPELVQTARDLQLGAGTDVAFIHLAVVSDRLHDAGEPVLGQTELLAEITVGAEGALELRLLRL